MRMSDRTDFLPPTGYIRDTGVTGLGVFSCREIQAGEIVEICPVVVIRDSNKSLPKEIRERVFNWGALCGELGRSAVALGYGSMYNHANPSNLNYAVVDGIDALRFVAARRIETDEELTINYNGPRGGNVSTDDTWFRARETTPIER